MVLIILQNCNCIVYPIQQQIYCLPTKLRGIKAIEQDRPSAALGREEYRFVSFKFVVVLRWAFFYWMDNCAHRCRGR
jgi:hypothetical protein